MLVNQFSILLKQFKILVNQFKILIWPKMKILVEVTNFEFWITKFDLGYEYQIS